MTLTLPVATDSADERLEGLPIAIVGAGPVGLAAAAHLLRRGLPFVVFEAGESAGAAIALWGHTRLFSPWRYVIDAAARSLLEDEGWASPDLDALPYGRDLVSDYLLPLAASRRLAPHIRYSSTVSAVTRQGMDRTRSAGRASVPFVLRVVRDGKVREELARAVIDTSGTYGNPNGVLASGLDPVDVDALRPHLSHALPDVLGSDRARFAGKRTLVLGAGHSAANTLIALAALAEQEPATHVTWGIRNARPQRVYTGVDDQLQDRAALGDRVSSLVAEGRVMLLDSFEVDRLGLEDGAVRVDGRRGGEPLSIETDLIVGATGFRPDLAMLREIRLALDDSVEAPRALAPLIDPNLHSCGTVPPHGVAELTQPEPNFFLAGMKSYGRAPTFLLLTGYEQVRSIADELAGDHEAARRVQLTLPETGVCSSGEAESCCSAPAAMSGSTRQPLQLPPSTQVVAAAEVAITVRPLLADDWPAVRDIYADGIASGNATFEAEPPSWKDFNRGKLPDHRFVAVDERDAVVGWIAVSPTSSRAVYRGVVEHSIYVAIRARRTGVGRRLLDELVRSTEAAGIWTIQSSIFPENEATLALHRSAGFRTVGTRERIARMTYGPQVGRFRDTLLVERRSPLVEPE